MKRWLSFLLACVMGLSALSVLAETAQPAPAGQAQVRTPGGSLNQREEPSTKSPLVQRIPNKATVLYHESVNDTWSRVTYKGRSGYVQTVYLNLAKTAEGKTVYAENNGIVFVREKPDDNAKIIDYLDNMSALTVKEITGDWAYITSQTAMGNVVEGYIHVSCIMNQHEQPQTGLPAYLNEVGEMRKKQALYATPYQEASVLATLPKGYSVVVLSVEGEWCRIRVDSTMLGYVPVSTVTLTGEQAQEAANFQNYTAVYYTCTVPGGILYTYGRPGDQDFMTPWKVSADEEIPVLLLAEDIDGRSWSKITYQGGTYWTPTADLVISDETRIMYYPEPIKHTTAAVVFAGKNGATLYRSATRFSDKLAQIPAGTELQGFLSPDFVSVTYNGIDGVVFYDEIITGLAEVVDGDWYYWQHLDDPLPSATPDPVLEEASHVTRSSARETADRALANTVAGFSAKGLDVRSDKRLGSSYSENPVYEFAYFKSDKYLYLAIVDAVTGECVRTADYSGFAQTVSHETKKPAPTERPGEISKSKARSIADGLLKGTYGSFTGNYNVVNEYFESVPGYDEPVYRMNYYHGEEHAYTCIVGAKSGNVLYHTDLWDPGNSEIDYSTPTPEPVYDSEEDIGEAAARAIAERTLTGKYPDFASQTFSSVTCRYSAEGGGFETPHYQFDYFVNGQLAYEILVHAWTGKVLYTFGSLPGEGNG